MYPIVGGLRPVLATAALLLGSVSQADAGEVFRLEGKMISPVTYDSEPPVRAQVNAGSFEFGVPVKAAAKTWLVPGASYRLEAPRFVDPPVSVPRIPILHEVEISIGLLQKFGERERWSLLVKANIGLAGDLAMVDVGALRAGGVVLGAYAFSDTFELGLGAGVTWAFGQVMPIPVVKLKWEPLENLKLEALLPAYLLFEGRPIDRLRAGIYAELVGNEYAIRDPDAQTFATCAGDDEGCLDHVAYTDGNAGGFVGVRLAGELWLEVHGGASFYRRFEMLDVEDEPVVNGDQRLRPAGFGKVRLTWLY